MTVTLEEIKQKLTELEAMIKAYEEQEEAEFPKIGDSYYWISTYGAVATNIWTNNYYDQSRYRIYNIFRTREEAEFAVEQLKVIAEMKRCGGKIEYKRYTFEGEDFFIRFIDDVVSIHSVDSFWGDWKMWFPTKEAAQKAINTIGKERLLKYWFCVEVEE